MANLWSNAGCSVRSAIVIGLILVATFVVLDSYTWRLLSVPWGFGVNEGELQNEKHHGKIISPEEAEQAYVKAEREAEAGHGILDSPDAEEMANLAPSSNESWTVQNVQSPVNNPPLHAPTPAPASPAFPSTTKEPGQHVNMFKGVEAGLNQARKHIKRAVTTGILETNCPFSGDVYQNSTFLCQSYHEMERRFKVYVYSEGQEPLVHNGPCKEIYAIEGRFIQELQEGNSYVTLNPEEAHLFFLPFSVSMMVTFLYARGSRNMSPLQHFVRDYVNVVKHKYPYWNQSGGSDHFMLSCHDWGPHISKAHPELEKNAIRMLCNANISEGYVPSKDASLPEIFLVGGHVPMDLGGLAAEDRKFLAFFAGADHGPVRPVLFSYWKEKDDSVRVYESMPSTGLSYLDYMKQSKYCLCPGGYEVNSPRLVEAIYYDCVPVIIADEFVLPFSDMLRWETFSIKVAQKDIVNLKVILESIPFDTYKKLQSSVRQVKQHFQVNQPPQKYDVFNMIMHSLWLRRINMVIHS